MIEHKKLRSPGLEFIMGASGGVILAAGCIGELSYQFLREAGSRMCAELYNRTIGPLRRTRYMPVKFVEHEGGNIEGDLFPYCVPASIVKTGPGQNRTVACSV